MDLHALGRLVAECRRARALSLRDLAAAAGVGRSTLAALESGKLEELGFAKVSRICEAIDLKLEARPLRLTAPLMAHRHLTEAAGRDLTKAAIEDVVTHGDFTAWRGLVRAMRAASTGELTERVREVVAALDHTDPKVAAFAALLPDLTRDPPRAEHER
jgi:transcriptional regulator with XRE-family HTH domain